MIPENCFKCDLNKECDYRWFLETNFPPDDCPIKIEKGNNKDMISSLMFELRKEYK